MNKEILENNGWVENRPWAYGDTYKARRLEEGGMQYWYNKAHVTELLLQVFHPGTEFDDQYNDNVNFELFKDGDYLVILIGIIDGVEELIFTAKVRDINEFNYLLKLHMFDFIVGIEVPEPMYPIKLDNPDVRLEGNYKELYIEAAKTELKIWLKDEKA